MAKGHGFTLDKLASCLYHNAKIQNNRPKGQQETGNNATNGHYIRTTTNKKGCAEHTTQPLIIE